MSSSPASADPAVQEFDVIIIGSGSGNSIPGDDYRDLRVAVVERGVYGGTCLNVGCIPTKMFVYPADLARAVDKYERLSLRPAGEEATRPRLDWADMQRRVFEERIDTYSAGGKAYRESDDAPHTTVIDGHARFRDDHTVEVTSPEGTVVLRAPQIIIATGARAMIPPVIRDSGVRYRTNVDIMRLEEFPSALIILGGGIIAVEFAHVFSSLGASVTLINRSEQVLSKLDATVRDRFTAVAEETWDCRLGREVSAARENADGSITLTLDDGAEVTADELLVALGRVPNTDDLGLESTAVEVDDRGCVVTDEFGRATVEGVWALGDAANHAQLKHVANHEARAVGHNLLHPEDLRPIHHEVIPAGIFTYPQIAVVGLTEDQAREQGHAVTVKVQEYADIAYGWAMEDRVGFCKVIADAGSGAILGAHIVGEQATVLIQTFVTAMSLGLDARVVAKNQYWPHPALTELVENALLGLEFTGEPPAELWA